MISFLLAYITFDFLQNSMKLYVFFIEGPPIRGPCGASYRPSENFAISSGHQPFLVEILIDPKTEVRENSPKCLGTIISSRHVLAAGNLKLYL